ncbi:MULTISPECIES: hypothetical protein [Acidobacterium]|uniref:Uncharacterized protein n=1 Tax=Acidobacterium capsulatum (strain ATCC 51196 / DSM 11244 / BCRC 80197 / JCM 7670 / NBRC 15755 / NCIMB 13165 / 161) TaxID=240015 RepID=C1F2K0_ACIC5|nr:MULTISPECIES: hypothetical protein [Acidobacterium]ACO32821.1 hypothetical protein ACP_2660 [Acidobacterium capsulatum ATCC 51196]HCT61479.1 hypothetical protein [Acidobacterium sp.]
MEWTAEALKVYEEKHRREAIKDEICVLRGQMRREQAPGRWIDLSGQLRACVVELNRKAGRTIISDQATHTKQYVLRCEESGATLKIDFHPEMYRVSIDGLSQPREFELTIRTKNGNDTAVWIDRQTGMEESDRTIAESVILEFLTVSA